MRVLGGTAAAVCLAFVLGSSGWLDAGLGAPSVRIDPASPGATPPSGMLRAAAATR
jgi:hypothetical protein